MLTKQTKQIKQIEDKYTIVVGTNSLTESQYPAYTNHCQFWFRLGRNFPNINFVFMNPARMSIDRMRNATVQAALDTGARYILFLDDDVIVHPGQGLQRLIKADADIAAAKIVIRGYPFDWMVFKYAKDKSLPAMKKLPIYGYFNADAVGFSFALLKTEIFKAMNPPWFVTGLNHTEDIYFCLKARDLFPDYSIKVDCEAPCGHILWPEVMDVSNREAYKEYMEKIEPTYLQQVKLDKASKKEAIYRGREYLKRTKKDLKEGHAY